MAKKDKKVKSKTKAKESKSVSKLKSLVYKDNRLNKKLGRVGKKYKVGKKSKYSVSKLKNTKSKVVKAKTSKKRSSSSKKTSVGANRYRSLISAISKWNKKQFEDTGMKLSRDEMYARYRMIRDEFPDVSTKDLVSNIGVYLQGRVKRTLAEFKKEKPDIAIDPIEWWDFESELQSASDWFNPDDIIRLRLENEDGTAKFYSLGFKSFSFEYKDLITSYANLYASGFTDEMRKYCSPPPVFVFSEKESDVEGGFYTFYLDCEDQPRVETPRESPIPAPTTPKDTKQGEINSINKQIENYQDEKKDLRSLLKDKLITKKEYNSDKKSIEAQIGNLRLQLEILNE